MRTSQGPILALALRVSLARQLWGTTSTQLARSGELERMLALERAESQRLRGALAEAPMAGSSQEPVMATFLQFLEESSETFFLLQVKHLKRLSQTWKT